MGPHPRLMAAASVCLPKGMLVLKTYTLQMRVCLCWPAKAFLSIAVQHPATSTEEDLHLMG